MFYKRLSQYEVHHNNTKALVFFARFFVPSCFFPAIKFHCIDSVLCWKGWATAFCFSLSCLALRPIKEGMASCSRSTFSTRTSPHISIVPLQKPAGSSRRASTRAERFTKGSDAFALFLSSESGQQGKANMIRARDSSLLNSFALFCLEIKTCMKSCH